MRTKKHIALAIGLSVVAYGSVFLFNPATAQATPMVIEFVCEEGDDVTERWIEIESARLYPSEYTTNMWEITSSTGEITYFVQRPGQRCSVIAYEVEPAPESSSIRA